MCVDLFTQKKIRAVPPNKRPQESLMVAPAKINILGLREPIMDACLGLPTLQVFDESKIDQPLKTVHNKFFADYSLFLEAWPMISVTKVIDTPRTDGMHFGVSLGGKKEMEKHTRYSCISPSK